MPTNNDILTPEMIFQCGHLKIEQELDQTTKTLCYKKNTKWEKSRRTSERFSSFNTIFWNWNFRYLNQLSVLFRHQVINKQEAVERHLKSVRKVLKGEKPLISEIDIVRRCYHMRPKCNCVWMVIIIKMRHPF